MVQKQDEDVYLMVQKQNKDVWLKVLEQKDDHLMVQEGQEEDTSQYRSSVGGSPFYVLFSLVK